MAIIQISRIQSRRGLQENLPQPLASAELGWAIDTRKLYIGNGTTQEGAPTLGNTEILTEFSDIFSLGGTYTFAGLSAGYRVQTGQSPLDPSSRSMQDKFDDIANFRDFHGVGNGVANEVSALNWAITQLYKAAVLSTEPRTRRTLHIPAGVYILSGTTAEDYIKLLPYVKLKGDGKHATYIIQTNALAPCVVGAAIMPGFVEPGFVEMEGLTLINTTNNDITQYDSAVDVLCTGVRMQRSTLVYVPGSTNLEQTLIDSVSTPAPIALKPLVQVGSLVYANSCVNFFKSSPASSTKFTFIDCDFVGQNFAFYSDTNVTNITVLSSRFWRLYRGAKLGTDTVGTDTVGTDTDYKDNDISNVKISFSTFDEIAEEGIVSALGIPGDDPPPHNIVSAFNTFKNVGNRQSTTSISPCISFGGDNCYSIGDTFDRAFNDAIPAVNLNGRASFATMPNGRTLLGKQASTGGHDIILLDGQTDTVTPPIAGIIGTGVNPTLVEYTIRRDAAWRTGTLKVAAIGTTVVYDDDYIETYDMGVTLTPTLNLVTNVIELKYNTTTTSPTLDATLKIADRTLI